MKFLNNLKLREIHNSARFQIIFSFIFLVIIISVLELFAYNLIVNLNEGSLKQDFKNLQKISGYLQSMSNEFLLIDKNSDNFFTTGKSESITEYEQVYKSLLMLIEKIKTELIDQGATEVNELDSLYQAANEFDNHFMHYVEMIKERGNHQSGIIGSFEKAIEKITNYNFGSDNRLVLVMQLLVKEYQIAGDPEILNKVKEAIYLYSTDIEAFIEDNDNADQVLEALDNYETPFTQLIAIDSTLGTYTGGGLYSKLTNSANTLVDQSLLPETQHKISLAYEELVNSAIRCLLIIFLSTLLLAVVITLILNNNIIKPIDHLNKVVSMMSLGIIPESIKHHRISEVKKMGESITKLANNLRRTSEFADKVGNRNFDASFTPLSDKDVLGNSLLSMQESLKAASAEDAQREWMNKGLNKFSVILRDVNRPISQLLDNILEELINYLNAGQGSLFLIEENNDEQSYLEMKSCYAWDRKKFVNKKIFKGQGLVGQCWIEGEDIYLKEVPEDFITIKSGLGEALPNNIFITPLIVNDTIFGVMEIASFNIFSPFKVDFVKEVASSIATTISTIKTQQNTKVLLDESREMTERLRSQEEEMLQNMEELQATQEETSRSISELSSRLEAINKSGIAWVEFDTNGSIISANEAFCMLMKYDSNEIVGKNHKILTVGGNEEHLKFWKDCIDGKPFNGNFKMTDKRGITIHLKGSYSRIAVKSDENSCHVLVQGVEITDLV